jgi:4-hydroxy-tetrahydrodipicolinate reductase
MGARIAQLVRETSDIELVAGFERPDHPLVGKDVGEAIGSAPLGVTVAAGIGEVLERCDVVIDFTSAAVSLQHLEAASQSRKPMVIGSTGFAAEQLGRCVHQIACLRTHPRRGVKYLQSGGGRGVAGPDYDVKCRSPPPLQGTLPPTARNWAGVAEALGETSTWSAYNRHGLTGERENSRSASRPSGPEASSASTR